MSEIKVNSIKGVAASTAALTINNTDGTCTANITNNLSNRNKVINGGMKICQRATTFAVTGSTNAYVVPDRFKCVNVHDGAYTLSQSTTSPEGFSSSIKVDVTTADTSLTTSQRLYFAHFIEAQDLQDLAYGTGSAKSVVVSFYVRSNKTGNYAFALNQADNGFKNISFQYTISSANTWERKSFVIPGDTSGLINNDNGTGIEMYFWLAAGPTYTSGSTQSSWTAYSNGDFAAGQGVNLLDSTSNEWYLTGVQFEINSSGVATDFEHRSFAQEIALCGRYYQNLIAANVKALGIGMAYNGATFQIVLEYPLGKMRTAPSIDAVTGGDYWQIEGGGLSPEKHIDGSFVAEHSTDTQMSFYGVPDSNFSDLGASHYLRSDNSACRFSFSAEL